MSVAILGGAAGVAGATVVGAGLWGTYAQNSRLFGRVVGHGPADRPFVYLTFDDGPNADATPRILETLAREGVPAAFFMVGRHVRLFPELARAAVAAGHEVGNHTDSHVKLHCRAPGTIRRELAAAHAVIVEATGRAPRSFRAPHGFRNPFVVPAARRLGYRVFGWSFGVWDTARPGPEEIRRRMRSKIGPGSILLLHDGDGYDVRGDRLQTAEALPGIIADTRAAGLDFRPLADLLG